MAPVGRLWPDLSHLFTSLGGWAGFAASFQCEDWIGPQDPQRPGEASGFTILHDDSLAAVDIIAVHGYNGSRSGSWTTVATGVSWVHDILPKDPRIHAARARIVTYGYDARLSIPAHAPMSLLSLQEHGFVLNRSFQALREESYTPQTRPVIFIAHCIGGIVLREALLASSNASADRDKLMSRCAAGFLYFGVPFHGSQHRISLRNVNNALKRHISSFAAGVRVNEQLLPDEQWLFDRNLILAPLLQHVPVKFYFEEYQTCVDNRPWPFGTMVQLVAPESAKTPGHKSAPATPISADHFGIVRLAGHPSLKIVIQDIADMIDGIAAANLGERRADPNSQWQSQKTAHD